VLLEIVTPVQSQNYIVRPSKVWLWSGNRFQPYRAVTNNIILRSVSEDTAAERPALEVRYVTVYGYLW